MTRPLRSLGVHRIRTRHMVGHWHLAILLGCSETAISQQQSLVVER